MKALIVEDSPTMRKMIQFCLKKFGGSVFYEAANGLEALEILAQNPIDLIFTDINMPDMDGLEFIETVRRETPYRLTPIIVVSTENSQEVKESAYEVGATAYLVKPFKATELEEILKGIQNGRLSTR